HCVPGYRPEMSHVQQRWFLVAAATLLFAGCAEDNHGPSSDSEDPDARAMGSDQDADVSLDAGTDEKPSIHPSDGGAHGRSDAGGGADAAAGSDAGSRDASTPDPLVPLPKGSREVDGIVNLVDAPAAQELEDYILGDPD